MNILITGACGVTSRSIVRSLLYSEKFKNSSFIGTDICENTYGLYEGQFSAIYKVPNVSEQGYKELMQKIIVEEKIDAAIIIPEPEVLFWSLNSFGVQYIVPPPKFSQTAINKLNLYEFLSSENLVPQYSIIEQDEIRKESFINPVGYPCWIRDFADGSTSGKGTFKASDKDQLNAWMTINQGIRRFMLSEYLPYGNYACHLLYNKGKLIKVAIYERLEYFMKHIVVSGISGNISRGKLINHELVKNNSIKAVDVICKKNEETMHGLVAVDLKEDKNKNPLITEINIRHVAATSAFASAGFNLTEFQLLCALNRTSEIDEEVEKVYPIDNMILRDIDGLPIWLPEYKHLEIGEKESRN